jgi:hypothetical protein
MKKTKWRDNFAGNKVLSRQQMKAIVGGELPPEGCGKCNYKLANGTIKIVSCSVQSNACKCPDGLGCLFE